MKSEPRSRRSLGLVEILSEHPYLEGGPADVQEHFATIRQNGRFLLALIDDLLDLRGSRRGSSGSSPRPCSPSEIVADVVETLSEPRPDGFTWGSSRT